MQRERIDVYLLINSLKCLCCHFLKHNVSLIIDVPFVLEFFYIYHEMLEMFSRPRLSVPYLHSFIVV